MNEDADRFDAVRRLTDEDAGSYNTPTIIPPPRRPQGAQPVAVRRKTTAVLAEIKALAAAAGEAWYYRWPVKDGDSKKWIEGASIKLANDLARTYGNCHVDVEVEENDTSWIFSATFSDLETGFSMTRPYQQRKNQRSIRGDADRQRDIAFQIGVSKAIRGIIVNSLQTYAEYGLEEARNALVDKIGKNLEGSRERLAQVIADRKIEPDRVERAIGRVIKEMLAPDIARVLAMIKTIDDGMASANETFPYKGEDVNPLANDQPAIERVEHGQPTHQPRQEPAHEPKPAEAQRAARTRRTRQEPTPTAQEVRKPDPPAAVAPATHKIQLHNGAIVEMTAEEIAWGKQQGWDTVQTAQHFLDQDKAAETGAAERPEENAIDEGFRRAQEREEQEGREAATMRPFPQSSLQGGSLEIPPEASIGGQSSAAMPLPTGNKTVQGFADEAAETRASEAKAREAALPIPTGSKTVQGFADASGFIAEAIAYIASFKGSAGSMLDWWRAQSKHRAKLAIEDQTRINQIYTAKFNSLSNDGSL
jgi:hypothetical protein